MYVTRLHIEGFKRFAEFDIQLNPTFNVLVGDNETGKSSILEALALVLSGQYDGRSIQYALDPYLFNSAAVKRYFTTLRQGGTAPPPQIRIEAYLASDEEDPALARLAGTNNTRNEDTPGLTLTIEPASEYLDDLKIYAADDSNPAVLPVEFYRATWRSFADELITSRELPFRVATIDANLPRTPRGPNKYISQVVADVLTDDQRRHLALSYKRLRHSFTEEPEVQHINRQLEEHGRRITAKRLTMQLDMSARTGWDTAIMAHLDDLPFDCAGRGEQCRVQLRLAVLAAARCRFVLIEEPENHLSHCNLNWLLDDIRRDCSDRQVIVTTHSAFVLNKLGIDNLRLISHEGKALQLNNLTPATRNYFMRLPGYDTLRLILARRSILVEGPSDELIVQRAYYDRHGKRPIEDGVDVIAVGSLAFGRFLEIAALLALNVRVVTDNDGDPDAVRARYARYLDGSHPSIEILFDDDPRCPTLESQLLKANSLRRLSSLLGRKLSTAEELVAYMTRNKTDCALKLFEAEDEWIPPVYIAKAVR